MDKMRSMELSSVAFAEAAKICSYQRQERVLREIQVHRKETRESRGLMERSFSESARRSDGVQNVVRAEAIGIRQGVSEMDQKLVKLEATNVGLQGMVENLLKCFLSGNERINPKTNDGTMVKPYDIYLSRLTVLVREPVLPENKLASKFARLRSLYLVQVIYI